jgi:hypothetical protein
VWITSWQNDPTNNTGANNAILFAMGSQLPNGAHTPPFHGVGFASGTQLTPASVNNAGVLTAGQSIINAKGFVLVAHYAVGEFCDVDSVPGYQGAWPPKSSIQIGLDLLSAISTGTELAADTFVAAAVWCVLVCVVCVRAPG